MKVTRFAVLALAFCIAPAFAQQTITVQRGSDDTAAIQRALDSGAAEVVIPYTGRPWVVRPLMLRSEQTITFEPGVVLAAEPGAFLGSRDAMFFGKNISRVVLVGYGATLRMRRDDYTQPPYEPSEWRHGIALHGVQAVTIRGLTIVGAGGDGIYIGPTWDDDRHPCATIYVVDCHLDRSYRTGLGIVSGITVTVDNVLITGTSGKPTQAGVLVEAAHPRDKLKNIVVKNCVAEGNAGTGFMFNGSHLSKESEPISVRFENCLVRDSVASSTRAIMNHDYGATGLVEFVHCTAQGSQYAGLTVVWHEKSRMALRFDGVRWADVAQRSDQEPFDLRMIPLAEGETTGTPIEFNGCVLYDNGTAVPVGNASGDIAVVGSAAAMFESTEPEGG